MDRTIDHKIIPAKKKLRKLSKDFKQNFKNIENYIKKEIYKIKTLALNLKCQTLIYV